MVTHCHLETTLSPSQHGWWAENLHLELFAAADPALTPRPTPAVWRPAGPAPPLGAGSPEPGRWSPCVTWRAGAGRDPWSVPLTPAAHTLPTAQMHTHAHNRAHACTTHVHTRVHTCRETGAAPQASPSAVRVEGANGVRQVWLQSPSPPWGGSLGVLPGGGGLS